MQLRRLGLLITPITDHDRLLMMGVIRYVREKGGWEISKRDGAPGLQWLTDAHW